MQKPKTRLKQLKDGVRVITTIEFTNDELVRIYEAIADEMFDKVARDRGYVKIEEVTNNDA